MFDQINIAVVVANEKHQVSDVNPAFVNMTGEALADIEGLDVSEVLLKYFSGVDVAIIDSGWQGRLNARDDDRHFDVTSVPIRSAGNKVIGYLVLLNDVTQVQKALDEISRLVGDTDSDRDDV